VLIRRQDGGPIFFRQERIGKQGETFRIWKFRTMIPGAEYAGSQLTAGGDPRITPIGARLRRLKLDELPQLFNILRGQMSFVGPRPEVPRFVNAYTEEQRQLLAFRPGLTDPASLAYRGEEAMLAAAADPERMYLEQILPAKARLSLDYARRATLLSDLRVIIGTVQSLGRPPAGASPAARPSLDRITPGAH